MKSFFLYTCFSLLLVQAKAQFSDIRIIDNDANTEGIRHMVSADFNNNGENDIVVAQGSTINQLAIYWNSGQANFSKEIIDHSIDDPVFINFGDFNSNGFMDILVVTESNSEVFFFENNNGQFRERIKLGSVQSLGKSIVVEDFDGDGDLDFVVIGRHSIDFYRNDGTANFSKEPILTTDTSPEVLECFAMVLADVNGDGIPDVVTGETIGIVAYINDGNANFTPTLISKVHHHTVTAIEVLDANGNHLPDLLFHSNSDVGVYLNQSSGQAVNFSFHGQILSSPSNSIRHFQTGDLSMNGSSDIFFANLGVPYFVENRSDMTFSDKVKLHDDPNLFVWTTLASDITGNGTKEIVWAAAGGTIAYHELEPVGLQHQMKNIYFTIYPNPTVNQIIISTTNPIIAKIDVFTLSGMKVISTNQSTPVSLDLNDLNPGAYIINVSSKMGSSTKTVIKQ